MQIYDTTLRDGAQQEGISLSVQDKLKITKKLDDLGITFIEGGIPGSNPKDVEYFKQAKNLHLSNSKIAAFGLTRRAGISADRDDNLSLLLDSAAPVVTLVGKSSDLHVTRVLETSLAENLSMISDSISMIKRHGRQVFFDAEHFFDGFKANAAYAIQSLITAQEAGADGVVLCDTNGGTLSSEIKDIVDRVAIETKIPLGIHCHNDTEMAVANTIVAVLAGATQVQGTINGYGERCGNTNLVSVIANLQLKMGIPCITNQQLASLASVSKFVSEIVNIPPSSQQPYVGLSSFSHKGGLHAAAVTKLEESYQHVDPSLVGNSKNIVVSELSGRGNIQYKIEELNLQKELNSSQISDILARIKVKENMGFQYESASASFELMVRQYAKEYKPPFELIDFMVLVENRRRSPTAGSLDDLLAEAMVKVRVEDRVIHTAAEGNGPVNALDNALRKGLIEFYPVLSDVRLADYKVRVVDEGQGTQATVRVLIDFTDGSDEWQTVGASGNIIEASWIALADSLEYYLLKTHQKNPS